MIANSCKRVWWKCAKGHEWSGLVVNRTQAKNGDPGCPYCAGRKVLVGYNDLATTHSDVAEMWHQHMNKKLSVTDV